MGGACLLPRSPAVAEPITASVRCVIIGPASAGKSLLQQKLLLDTPATTSIPVFEELYSAEEAEMGQGVGKGFAASGSRHIRSGAIATGITAGPCIRFLQVFDVPAAELYRHLQYAEADEEATDGDDGNDVGRYEGAAVESQKDDFAERSIHRLSPSARERDVGRRSSGRVSLLAHSSNSKSLPTLHPFMALLRSASYLLLVFDASDPAGDSLAEATGMYERLLPYLTALHAGKVTLVATKTDLVAELAEEAASASATAAAKGMRGNSKKGIPGGFGGSDGSSSGPAFFLREAADWAQQRGSRVVEVSGLTGQGVRRLRAEMR